MDTPTATEPALSPDISDADLLAAADAADNGRPIPAPASNAAEATPDTPPAEGEQAKPVESADDRADRETAEAALKKDEPKPAESKPAEKPPVKPETPYQQAKKDAERLEKTWKSVNEAKIQIDQKERAIEAERAEFARVRAELEAIKKRPAAPTKDENGLEASDYEVMAKRYAEQGDDTMAKLATERAASLRAKTASAPQHAQTAPDITSPDFQAKWRETTAALVQADPDLAKADNPVVQAANALLQNKDWSAFFLSRPDGIRAAVEVARLQNQAQRAGQLAKELETHKAEVARLTKLVSPRGSLPANAAPSDRRPEDLSTAEMLALAAQADASGG
jgi:hypothetical protein